MTSTIKRLSRKILPHRVRFFITTHVNRLFALDEQYKKLSNKKTFEKIYRDKVWGEGQEGHRQFFSGGGSHDEIIVSGYIEAVGQFLGSRRSVQTVVDLGCGDFYVGSKLLSFAPRYIACDIVEDVINENRQFFQREGLEFRVLDLVDDEIPKADVITVRQVLQHLSNADIEQFVAKVPSACRDLIVTEHIPAVPRFTANLDKPSGPETRLVVGSGVVLTEPPFNLRAASESVLCEFEQYGGLIRTVVYSF